MAHLFRQPPCLQTQRSSRHRAVTHITCSASSPGNRRERSLPAANSDSAPSTSGRLPSASSGGGVPRQPGQPARGGNTASPRPDGGDKPGPSKLLVPKKRLISPNSGAVADDAKSSSPPSSAKQQQNAAQPAPRMLRPRTRHSSVQSDGSHSPSTNSGLLTASPSTRPARAAAASGAAKQVSGQVDWSQIRLPKNFKLNSKQSSFFDITNMLHPFPIAT